MATIRDVARLAGVSIKTVSRVINHEASVRQSTRDAVTRAVAQLNFEPHRGARMMRGQGSGLIGMITGAVSASGDPPDVSGLSAIHIVRGALQACREAGKTLMIADALGAQSEAARLLRVFESHSAEGVIFATDYHRQVVLPLSGAVPVVLANCYDAAGTPAVLPDDYGGQRAATEHLADLGHGRIGMLGLEESLVATQLRRQGFFDALRERGLPLSDSRFVAGYTDQGGGTPADVLESALREMLSEPGAPSAIMFGNDLMALKALPYIKAAGLTVPEDVSLAGFDNDVRICETVRPQLTTVQLPYHEIGRLAAEQLLSILDGGDAPRVSRVPCEVVERGSVSPKPAAADVSRIGSARAPQAV